MAPGDDALHDLREALKHSPDNVPLRQHVGDLMLRRGLLDEAETSFREGLNLSPVSEQLKLGLARCYYLQGKNSAALVIVEELVKRPTVAAASLLLQARLLLRSGEVHRAQLAYRRALDAEPTLADPDLAEVLGLEADIAVVAEEEEDEDECEMAAQPAAPPPRPLPEPGCVTSAAPHMTEVDFSDVGGMTAIKEQIRLKIIHPVRHPEIYEAYGKTIGGGLLLYGPPGCGKTHLARATAGEIEAAFIAVGIHEVLDMYVGQSELRLHEIFAQARRNRPCVLFFDEVDGLGANRADMRNSVARQLINQFLAELDGIQDSNDGVLVLAATNAPWHVDPAFRRPGRLDRGLFVPPPDRPGRAAIMRVLLRGKPVDDVDHELVARKTKGFSGADLAAMIDRAVDRKLEHAMNTGQAEPLRTRDLVDAATQMRCSTADWFATARSYALFANHGGAYDDVLKHLGLM